MGDLLVIPFLLREFLLVGKDVSDELVGLLGAYFLQDVE